MSDEVKELSQLDVFNRLVVPHITSNIDVQDVFVSIKAKNPAINYGTGGLLHGKRYMVSTTWNAPETAFTLPNEFFQQKSVDEGVLFPFHRMNAFIALTQMESIHFHDVEKNMNNDRLSYFKNLYLEHLNKITLQLSDC